MADWNLPSNSTLSNAVLGILNEKIADSAKMDYTGDTNIPAGTIQYNTTTRAFETWNGSAWGSLLFNEIRFTATSSLIATDTADGADSKQLRLTGGGAIGSSRGAYIVLAGNEHANSGALQLFGGAIAGANVDIYTSLSGNNIRFYGNNLLGWSITGSGRELTQDATNGGDVVFGRTSALIRTDTADGSDNKSITIAGGGAAANTRGARTIWNGNETASGGCLDSHTGDATNAHYRVYLNASSSLFQVFNHLGSQVFSINGLSGDLFSGSGNFFLPLGRGIGIGEGTNARMGAATLVGGTVTVNTTRVTANSRIILTGQNSSGTHGELTVSARTAGTSFTITSSSGTDTRSIAWVIFEPA